MKRLTIGLLGALLLTLGACGGGGGGSAGGNGSLNVSLTDAPACGYDEVNITVQKVRVHQSASAGANDAGWTDLDVAPARKIDLLDLTNGILETLGQTPLPAGHYTQVRLVLAPNGAGSPANSVVIGGVEKALDTPSGTQSGVKLNREFDVAAGQTVDLVIDFDACKSVVSAGNSGKYLLKPVITATPTVGTVSGYISGFVPTGLSNAVVSAQQNGEVIKSTIPDSTGMFKLSPIPDGNYDVVIVADNKASVMIKTVPVTAGQATLVSDNTTPVALTDTTMNSASGAVTPASVGATVRAVQTFTGGEKMEVRFSTADTTTGNYSMNLPIGAPSLGTYSTTLPISLSADNAVAGKYTLEALATGQTTQTKAIDVSSAAAVENFAF